MGTHEHTGNLFHEIFHEIFLHGLIDTLKIIPFLFLTYLLMELLEHKASDKTRRFMQRSGPLAPIVGGALGAVPQCGFSSVTANLYAGRVVSMGTVIAVFLSTSDEMLPIMISGGFHIGEVLLILSYKILVGIFVGLTVDLVFRLTHKHREEMHIHEMCEEEGCHCEGGILRSSLHHTLSISLFILIITFAINALVFFVGTEKLSAIMNNRPVLSHIAAAFFGLIPNCASSVALTEFYTGGIISLGTMLSGLFSGAGVGLLVLFKVNRKNIRQNLMITGILVVSGILFGVLADLIGFAAWF